MSDRDFMWIRSFCISSDLYVDVLFSAWNSVFRFFKTKFCRVIYHFSHFSQIGPLNKKTMKVLQARYRGKYINLFYLERFAKQIGGDVASLFLMIKQGILILNMQQVSCLRSKSILWKNMKVLQHIYRQRYIYYFTWKD